MKIATKIAGILMSCLTLCTALQPVVSMAQNTEMARPRSTIDLSRTDRLTGTPNPQETPLSCPSGQVYSGGTCVLISNQGTRAGEVLALDGGVGGGSVRCPSGYTFIVEYGPDEVQQGFPRTLLCRKL